MKKIIFIIVILSIATVGGVVLRQNASGTKGNNVAVVLLSNNGQQLHKTEFTIDGMWCASCATGAEYSLKEIEGVADAYVGFTDNLDGEGWVVYEKGKVTEEQIIQAIEPYKTTIEFDTVYIETKS